MDEMTNQAKYIVYYESIKREPKIRGIYECRCDERLQTKLTRFFFPKKISFFLLSEISKIELSTMVRGERGKG
jgi:hypothetical protein